jgi:hypothetical protein
LRDDDSAGVVLDKPWVAIDTRRGSPHRNRIYATWDEYHGVSAVNAMTAYADARPDGTHMPWSDPKALPTTGSFPNGGAFELPHVAANGWVYTTLTTTTTVHHRWKIGLDVSKDGGRTWSYAGTVAQDIVSTPDILANTTTLEGIPYSFAVGNDPSGSGPLYVVWEDFSRGIRDLMLSTSTDAGRSWSTPIRVNDNTGVADAFQPTLTVQDAAPGTVSVSFYDRRLACPGTTAAADLPGSESYGAGLRLDTVNPKAPVPGQPPYGITNYCIDASVQYYRPDLSLFADHPHNIRVTQHSWDPQLNAHRSSADPSQQTHFIGDYFGSVISGGVNTFAFVSTFDDVTKAADQRNPANRQQQVAATLPVPTH